MISRMPRDGQCVTFHPDRHHAVGSRRRTLKAHALDVRPVARLCSGVVGDGVGRWTLQRCTEAAIRHCNPRVRPMNSSLRLRDWTVPRRHSMTQMRARESCSQFWQVLDYRYFRVADPCPYRQLSQLLIDYGVRWAPPLKRTLTSAITTCPRVARGPSHRRLWQGEIGRRVILADGRFVVAEHHVDHPPTE
jgi:hypothetical protein